MLVFLYEVRLVYTSQGIEIKLGGLLIRPTITIQLLSDEQSSVRMAGIKKARKSSARVKVSSTMPVADAKVDKSSPAEDAGMSDLLEMNFLSSSSAYVKLVDHINQTIWNSFVVAPSSAQLSELEKKNADLTSKLSAKQIRYKKKMSELRAMIYELKSSLAEKDSELSSFAANFISRKMPTSILSARILTSSSVMTSF
ncbi:unnamed protein product [Prunus armeniaca]